MAERRKRTVPSGKRKILVVPVHGMSVPDVLAALQSVRAENSAGYSRDARCYVNPDGDIVVAINNWMA